MSVHRMLVLLPLLVAASAPPPQAATADPRQALAEQVLIASGNDVRVAAINRSVDVHGGLLAALKQALPEATDAWEPAMRTAIDNAIREEQQRFFEENLHIYATRFSEAELKDMLDFYRSPGGRALVAQTPAIIAEKAAFGRTLAQDVMKHAIDAVCATEKCTHR
jgi:hypothetical protein